MKCSSVSEYQCQDKMCIEIEKVCDGKADCKDETDEMKCEQCSATAFNCLSGTCINRKYICDGYNDCDGNGADEEKTMCRNVSTTRMSQMNETRVCKNGEVISSSEMCLFRFNSVNRALGCRDRSHLNAAECQKVDCDELTGTTGKYSKCPTHGYCIPNEYICNDHCDCGNCEDEQNCQSLSCSGMFRCDGAKFCLSLEKVCDGKQDCPKGDDEVLCDVHCPSGCHCFARSMVCRDKDFGNGDIQNAGGSELREIVMLNTLAEWLYLNKQGTLLYLYRLYVESGEILSNSKDLFEKTTNLVELVIVKAGIKFLKPFFFSSLKYLKILRIIGSNIKKVDNQAFFGLSNLEQLSLSSMDKLFEVLDWTVFSPLKKLKKLETQAFLYCCLASKVLNLDECVPKQDGFSNCEDLLHNYSLRIMVWFIGMLSLLGNSVVMIWKIGQRDLTRSVPSLLIFLLVSCDLLMGVYLIVIASADTHYRGRYMEFDEFWRHSLGCSIAGFLATFSSIMSVFILCLLSVDRMVNITMPDKRIITMRRVLIVFCILALIMVIITTFPMLPLEYFNDQISGVSEFYVRSEVCLSLHLRKIYHKGWEYSIFLFLILPSLGNLIMLICSLIILCGIFCMSFPNMRESKSQSEMNFTKTVLLMMTCNIACWMPIIITEFLFLGGTYFSSTLYSWILLFLLPLRSSMNPIIYLVSVLMRKIREAQQRGH